MKLFLLLIFLIFLNVIELKTIRHQKKAHKKHKRKLGDFFITTTWDANEKELMREAVANKQNEYTFERHLDNEDGIAMNEVNQIYETVKSNVQKSKDTLLNSIDLMFNNLVYQNKWFY